MDPKTTLIHDFVKRNSRVKRNSKESKRNSKESNLYAVFRNGKPVLYWLFSTKTKSTISSRIFHLPLPQLEGQLGYHKWPKKKPKFRN